MPTDEDNNDIPLAKVTESNGEISCSIEETNRIRLALGLKPLDNRRSKEIEAVENFKKNAEEKQKVQESIELRDRLEKAKNKRLLNAKLDGASLSDITTEDEGAILSASDWVRRSRKKELSEKERARLQAEVAAKRKEEEEEENVRNLSTTKYDENHLAGLKVLHSMESIDSGETVVLTLADSSILEKDEHGKVIGVHEETDVLENVNLADEERRLEREKIKKRAKQPVYSGYDDMEFAEGVAPGTRPSILSHYDKEEKSGPKLVLGQGGIVYASKAEEKLAEEKSGERIPQSLRVETKELAEYYTKAEFSAFAKPKKDKKKRKIRKKEDEGVVEAGEGQGGDSSSKMDLDLDAMESQALEGSGHADRGSRSNSKANSNPTQEQQIKNKMAYDRAVLLAEQKVQKSFVSSSTASASASAAVVAEEDDAEIAQSLARARRLALQKPKTAEMMGTAEAKSSEEDSGAAQVKLLFEKQKQIGVAAPKQTTTDSNTDVLGGLDTEGRKEDGTLVFTSTTEFTARLQARLNERARTVAEAVVREQEKHSGDLDEGGTGSVLGRKRAALSSEPGKKSSWKELVQEKRDSAMDVDGVEESKEAAADSDDDADDIEDDQLGFVHKQPLLSKGIAGALALLKETGDLKKKDELAGRANDGRVIDPSAPENRIKLEYRDEFGRKLTQKEAFRQLSYRFHGHGPGHKKREKRLKEMELANKSATSKNALETGTMLSLTRAQEATGKAHITIQGGVNSADMAQALAKKKSKVEKSKESSKQSSYNF